MVHILQKNFRPGRPPVWSYSRTCGVGRQNPTRMNFKGAGPESKGSQIRPDTTFGPWVRWGCLGYFYLPFLILRCMEKVPSRKVPSRNSRF